MAVSEIDDIFSGKVTSVKSTNDVNKGKRKAVEPVDSNVTIPKSKKKKKKQKKAEQADPDEEEWHGFSTAESQPSTSTTVQVVLDTSNKPTPLPPKKRQTAEPRPSAGSKSRVTKDSEGEARFKDSRGTGPRRKTEEGWSIFKEDELGINDVGGDTPLCPFDCECCF